MLSAAKTPRKDEALLLDNLAEALVGSVEGAVLSQLTERSGQTTERKKKKKKKRKEEGGGEGNESSESEKEEKKSGRRRRTKRAEEEAEPEPEDRREEAPQEEQQGRPQKEEEEEEKEDTHHNPAPNPPPATNNPQNSPRGALKAKTGKIVTEAQIAMQAQEAEKAEKARKRAIFVKAQDVMRRMEKGEEVDLQQLGPAVVAEIESLQAAKKSVAQLNKEKEARAKRREAEEERRRAEITREMEADEERRRAEAARLEEQRVQELQARRRERLAEAERRKATMEVLRAQEAQKARERKEKGVVPIHERLEQQFVLEHVLPEEARRKEHLKRIHESFTSPSKEELGRHQAEAEAKKASILAKKEADRVAARAEAKAVKAQLDLLYRSKLLDQALAEDFTKRSAAVRAQVEAKIAHERKVRYADDISKRNKTKISPHPARLPPIVDTSSNNPSSSDKPETQVPNPARPEKGKK